MIQNSRQLLFAIHCVDGLETLNSLIIGNSCCIGRGSLLYLLVSRMVSSWSSGWSRNSTGTNAKVHPSCWTAQCIVQMISIFPGKNKHYIFSGKIGKPCSKPFQAKFQLAVKVLPLIARVSSKTFTANFFVWQ